MVIYVLLNDEGVIEGWGTSKPNEDAIKVEIENDHPFLEDIPMKYTIRDGELVLSNSSFDIELKSMKQAKKQELSSECQEDILSGFDFEIGDNTYHFSYDREAQMNLQERWQLFQNNIVEEMNITAHLGEEDVRLKVDRELFDEIYLASVKTKENKIKKLREDLFPLVDNVKSKKDLEVISWKTEIIEPTPETVVIKNDELLNKEIKRVETSSAVSASEMMNLIFMTQTGMFNDTPMMPNTMNAGGDIDV